MSISHLRIARPVTNLTRSTNMYTRGLGLQILGSFRDHEGFDGVMLGIPDAGYHFEFVHAPGHPVTPTPTVEDLVVCYVPVQEDWDARCQAMLAAGFAQVPSFNPYWDVRGRTFQDPDGYRVVVERAQWRPSGAS